jgi:alpha-amylase
VSPQDYISNQFNELGDFVQGIFNIDLAETTLDASLIELSRNGYVGNTPITIKKMVRLDNKGSLIVDYRFQGSDKDDISVLYGCEFNLTLFSDQDENRYYFIPGSGRRSEIRDTGSEEGIAQFDLINEADGLTTRFIFSKPVSVWFYPIITVSQSEQGFERTYQGSSLLFVYPMTLSPNQKEHLQIQLQFIEL